MKENVFSASIHPHNKLWGFLEVSNKILGLLIISSILVLDQITKAVAGGFLSVTCNKGVALGISLAEPFDIVLPIIFIIVIFYFLERESRVANIISMSMLFGGGVSNLLDRAIGGCVRDFIPLGLFSTFNVADAVISLGVVLFLVNIRGSTPDRGRTPTGVGD